MRFQQLEVRFGGVLILGMMMYWGLYGAPLLEKCLDEVLGVAFRIRGVASKV